MKQKFSTGSLLQLGLKISTTQSAAWPDVKKSRQSRPSIMLRIRRDIAQTCNLADNRLRPGRETATWREAGRRQLQKFSAISPSSCRFSLFQSVRIFSLLIRTSPSKGDHKSNNHRIPQNWRPKSSPQSAASLFTMSLLNESAISKT